MTNESFLTAKVYIDNATPNIDPQPAFQSFDLIAEHAPLVPMDEVSRLTVAPAHTEYLTVDQQEWPRVEADINIILTERDLVLSKQVTPTGRLRQRGHIKGNSYDYYVGYSLVEAKRRMAFVQTANISCPEITAAHEIGHMIGVLEGDELAHCLDQSCIMTETLDETRKNWNFCNDCSEEMEFNYERLLAIKHERSLVARILDLLQLHA